MMRGALFSALEAMGADFSRVLDVYAGTGALGIEALSRGANRCDFVERDRAMAGVIRDNLEATGFADRGMVYPIAAERALDRLEGGYTVILADPPYADASAPDVLERLARSALVADDAVVVLEHSAREEARSDLGPFHLAKQLRHGDSAVSIYLPAGDGGDNC
jgi:16S rRNA (guanine966-N2)-methyltransferase